MIGKGDKNYAEWSFKQEQNRHKPLGNRHLNGIFKHCKQTLIYLLTICKAKSGLEFIYKENLFEREYDKEEIVIPFRLFYIKIPTEIDTDIDPNRLGKSIKEQLKEFISSIEEELKKRNLEGKSVDIDTATTEGTRQLCLVVSRSIEEVGMDVKKV